MCNVCLSYLSMPIFSFSVPKGGDFIDASAASVAGEGATRVRAIKETAFPLQRLLPGQGAAAISVYYEDMIAAVTGALARFLSKSKNVPVWTVRFRGHQRRQRHAAGFRDRFEKLFRGWTCRSRFPRSACRRTP